MHRRQHFIPRSYLEAWCDPQTPVDQQPYVWVFPKDGGDARRRAPRNIFHETDFYTIHLPSGQRDLQLEHGLAGLESHFADIRRSVLLQRAAIDLDTRVKICAFVAAMQVRTPRQKEHFQGIWGQVLDNMEQMKRHMLSLTAKQRADLSRSTLRPTSSGPSLGIEDVRKLATAPLQHMLVPAIQAQLPQLAQMNLAVLATDEADAFITSDAPCVWFDPEAQTRPFLYGFPGLGWPTIEVTLPISPTQLLLINRAGVEGYYSVTHNIVAELNRRTRGHAHEHFIANSAVANPVWYAMGSKGTGEVDPPDA